MDSHRFDGISRALAFRSNRRRFGGQAAMGAVGLALGLRRVEAQDDSKTCNFDLTASVVAGPNAGTTFQGELTLPIGSGGAIDDGSFIPSAGSSATVVGQAANRRLRLRIDLGSEGVLALSGVALRIVTGCRGEMNGIFGGPEMGDLGAWSVVRHVAGSEASVESSSGASASPAATRTPCPPVDCGSGTFVLDPETCECGCPPPYDRCGDLCCPGGSVCLDPDAGECQCPEGTELCNEQCTPICPEGQFFDASCQCSSDEPCPAGSTLCPGLGCVFLMTDRKSCGTCGNYCQPPDSSSCVNGVCQTCIPDYDPYHECSTNSQCCSGFCASMGTAPSTCDYCPYPYTICGDKACRYLVDDEYNCGSCGNVCAAGVPCIAGICTCPPGLTQCPGGCSDLTDAGNCGSCGNACASWVSCTNGACCNPSGVFAECAIHDDCCSNNCYYDAVARVQYCT